MIVGSLLLILVAVTLLILGLGAGSSALLISSIVVSLLAAVALVIGARQSVGKNRTVPAEPEPAPLTVDLDDDPGPAAPVEETAGWASPADDVDPFARPRPGSVRSTVASTDTEILDRDAVHAGHPPADDDLAPAVPLAEDSVRSGDEDPYADFHRLNAADEGDSGEADARELGVRDFEAYEREVRDRAPEHTPDDIPVSTADADADAEIDLADDDEDPADEPAPQRVQPADAVRVSRMAAEVLVVDGRPRYHLGDCASLDGRVTEPLPVAEAVELGFTPCSMCRPATRLVTETAHH